MPNHLLIRRGHHFTEQVTKATISPPKNTFNLSFKVLTQNELGDPTFCYRNVMSMIQCNFLQNLKNSMEWVQNHLKVFKVVPLTTSIQSPRMQTIT